MKKKKWPIEKYPINSDENPCCCFQVTRRFHVNGDQHYRKSTIFLSKENNTLGYLEFRSDNFVFWDEYIAVWKIKSLKKRL